MMSNKIASVGLGFFCLLISGIVMLCISHTAAAVMIVVAILGGIATCIVGDITEYRNTGRYTD